MAFHADKIEEFRASLEKHHEWPCEYTFKFIVHTQYLERALSLFPNDSIQIKNSSQGKYSSLTWTRKVQSSDEIISAYLKASEIEGIIAL